MLCCSISYFTVANKSKGSRLQNCSEIAGCLKQSNCLRVRREEKRSLFSGLQKTHSNIWDNQLKMLILCLTACLGHAPGIWCVTRQEKEDNPKSTWLWKHTRSLWCGKGWQLMPHCPFSRSLKNPLWCKGDREGHTSFSIYYHKSLPHCTENFLAVEIPLAKIK